MKVTAAYLGKLWSQAVRLKAKGYCEVCRQPGRDTHHLIKRNTNALKYKWDIKNGVCLCRTCHMLYEDKVDLLLRHLTAAQIEWYVHAKNDKRFIKVAKEQVAAILKEEIAFLERISSEVRKL